MGRPIRVGPFVFHVKHRPRRSAADTMTWINQAMKSWRSRMIAAFGLAPTMVLATSPPW